MRKKIMVVDDNKEFLEELTELLTLSDYDTEVFTSGMSALKEADKVKPDLILLDLKMNGKSGFQVAEELKEIPGVASVPIIAMTGYYTEKEHAMLMKVCGIKACLTKPFNPLDVITKIEELL